MTLESIVQEIYEGLGEPSDLEFRSGAGDILTGSTGWLRLVDAVNRACIELSTWKFPEGRTLKFRSLEANTVFASEVLTATVSDGAIGTATLTTSLPIQADNYYAGWVVTLANAQYRVFMSTTALSGTDTDLLVLSPLEVDPVGETISASRREYTFVAATPTFGTVPTNPTVPAAIGTPLEIISVYDMTSATELETLSRDAQGFETPPSVQTPTAYYKVGRGLRFDTWPDASANYTVRFFRTPNVLAYADTTAVPELPENYHRAIVLWGMWWGYRRMQENNSAYATKRDLDDLLRHIRGEYDLEGQYSDGQVFLNVDGRF
ncbi:MAG TPA: hypothetical protein VLH56_18825 [Dissulfurispiraceae bacterium]|nr:hypothetical protein [Dissulfurispiraceae bacterium]